MHWPVAIVAVRSCVRVGARVPGWQYMREDWDEVKDAIMVRVNVAKFSQQPALLDLLLRTGEQRCVCRV